MLEFDHLTDRQRLIATQDGERVAHLDYELADQVATITHTVTEPKAQGQGIAGRLTARFLDHARAQGWRVVPECSYAVSYIERHSEYVDLLV